MNCVIFWLNFSKLRYNREKNRTRSNNKTESKVIQETFFLIKGIYAHGKKKKNQTVQKDVR